MESQTRLVKLLVCLLTFLVFATVFSISTSAQEFHDQNDGIYYNDFSSPETVSCDDNCSINEENELMLEPSVNAGEYFFTEECNHEAWWYQSYFFNILLPPTITFFQKAFDRYDKPGLYLRDGVPADTPSKGLKRTVVHHFRFKLDGDASVVGSLNISWFGNASADVSTRLYYYYYYTDSKNNGRWKLIDDATSNGQNIILNHVFIEDDDIAHALDDEYNIHLCVVTRNFAGHTTLNTDFINISSEIEGYHRGTAEAVLNQSISPTYDEDKFYWEKMTWEDTEPLGTSVKYQLLYLKDDSFVPVPDTILDGNEDGFTSAPVYITSIPNSIKQLRIKMILSSRIPLYTPKVYSLTVTWQTNEDIWQDQFNSTERIDQKIRINHTRGKIKIKPVFGDWPLQGYDAQNTRATEGKGPTSDVLNWYYSGIETPSGAPLRDPVIADETLYITRSNKPTLFLLSNIHTVGTDIFKKYPSEHRSLAVQNLNLENSPAITDDYLILATGSNPVDASQARNLILFYDKDTHAPLWNFDYGENIVYWASPVVHEDTLFITSWSYDDSFPPRYKNNEVLALDITKTIDQTKDDLLWQFSLPAESYSTPAVYNDIVYAGCDQEIGKNLFALDVTTGRELWNASVGRIGRSSPVVSNDVVYILSHSMGRMKLDAFHYKNGSKLWTKNIGLSAPFAKEASPAIYGNTLFVANTKGAILALDLQDEGNTLWKEDYHFGTDQTPVSPAYSEGIIYIGFSNGYLYGLDAATGDEKFRSQTDDFSPIVTSPVISNGLVYFCDARGIIYSIGAFREPTKGISGSLLSIPISLPENKWWQTFYADKDDTNGTITFNILDEEKNILQTIKSGDNINFADQTVHRTIRLQALLEAGNISLNPELYSWRVTFDKDEVGPWLKRETLTPGPWLTDLAYLFTINVEDNHTGLDINSAECQLTYSTLEGTYTESFDANCSGSDGTTNVETITIDLTQLDKYQDITDIHTIKVSIMDLAGNTATETFDIIFDNLPPTSEIDEDAVSSSYSSNAFTLEATAADTGDNISGIEKVELYYRYATTESFSGSWTLYEDDYTAPYSWEFSYANVDEKSGYYEILSNAVDKAGNTEQEISSDLDGDASFLYDPKEPNPPDIDIDADDDGTLWIKDQDISFITFSDDFKLKKIEYQPNFDTEWETIATSLTGKTYSKTWSIKQAHWDQMNEGETYYLSFRITDSVGNTYLTESNERLTIQKDIATPQANLELEEEEREWSWDETFTISAFSYDGEGSGIKSMTLEYIFSEDDDIENKTWTAYKTVAGESYEFEFKAEQGNGYYKFRLITEDLAGNTNISAILSTGINIFPTTLLTAFAAVSVLLIILLFAAFIIWRKSKD